MAALSKLHTTRSRARCRTYDNPPFCRAERQSCRAASTFPPGGQESRILTPGFAFLQQDATLPGDHNATHSPAGDLEISAARRTWRLDDHSAQDTAWNDRVGMSAPVDRLDTVCVLGDSCSDVLRLDAHRKRLPLHRRGYAWRDLDNWRNLDDWRDLDDGCLGDPWRVSPCVFPEHFASRAIAEPPARPVHRDAPEIDEPRTATTRARRRPLV